MSEMSESEWLKLMQFDTPETTLQLGRELFISNNNATKKDCERHGLSWPENKKDAAVFAVELARLTHETAYLGTLLRCLLGCEPEDLVVDFNEHAVSVRLHYQTGKPVSRKVLDEIRGKGSD